MSSWLSQSVTDYVFITVIKIVLGVIPTIINVFQQFCFILKTIPSRKLLSIVCSLLILYVTESLIFCITGSNIYISVRDDIRITCEIVCWPTEIII